MSEEGKIELGLAKKILDAKASIDESDPRFRCGFDVAMTFLKLGYRVRRADWPQPEGYVLVEGLLLAAIGRVRIHSMAIGDILADDWTVAVISK